MDFLVLVFLNPATCNPPAPAGGLRRRPREVAFLMGASGSCRRGLHYRFMLF